MQAYIDNLGNKIVRANGLHKKPYEYNFLVVKSDYINAFALPAGHIFVTVPLLSMAETEAELAGVVGHEIGHVTSRHAAERLQKSGDHRSSMFKSIGIGAGIGAVAGAAIGSAACKKDKKYKECMAKAAVAGGILGAAGGYLVAKYKFMQNSQDEEFQADKIGFETSVKAGYSKVYVGKFYEKLYRMDQDSGGASNPLTRSISDAMSTHPPSGKRVEKMNQLVETSPSSGTTVSSGNFDRIRKLSENWTKKNVS